MANKGHANEAFFPTCIQLAELIEDEEELAEIDTSNIVWTGRRRNAPLDYSSEEALKQAGLDTGAAAADQEEDDAEFHVSWSRPASNPRLFELATADSLHSLTQLPYLRSTGRGDGRTIKSDRSAFLPSSPSQSRTTRRLVIEPINHYKYMEHLVPKPNLRRT